MVWPRDVWIHFYVHNNNIYIYRHAKPETYFCPNMTAASSGDIPAKGPPRAQDLFDIDATWWIIYVYY